jgi:hypothetical protein
LLRGDLAARSSAYVQAVTNGWMSANEVRERENLNPYTGGDEYYHPLNISSNPATPPTPQRASLSALEPLYLDALARVLRRESNDLRGAARRFLAKGQPEAFASWLGNFYQTEQPAFIERQFSAVLAAEQRLFQRDHGPQLQTYFKNYLPDRYAWATLASLEQIEAEPDLDDQAQQIFTALLSATEASND